MIKKTDISIIIPCYNEANNIKRGALQQVYDYLIGQQKFSWELIVSDDGSSDDSLNLVKEFASDKKNLKVLENKHGGKPWAVWKGIEKATGKLVLFTDLDQSTPIVEIEKLLPWFGEGYQVVIGSRGKTRKDASWFRKLMAFCFLLFRKTFLLRDILDTQCGFKAFERKVALEIFPRLQFFQELDKASGWNVSAFDVELLFITQKWGYRIKEIEINWKNEDTSTSKKQNFIKESKNMAKEIFRVRLNDYRGKYERKRA
ncbi:MAG: glycosyltransferase [Patescibacteria group bacterium]